MATIHLTDFRQAMREGDLERSMRALVRVGQDESISIHDALQVVLLAAWLEDERFDRLAERWLEKLEDETLRSDVEASIARAALPGLKDERTFSRCEMVLRDLLRWVDPMIASPFRQRQINRPGSRHRR